MDPLSIIKLTITCANTLYFTCQQRRRNSKAACELRQKLIALQKHIATHHGAIGKTREESVSMDIFDAIVSDLEKLYDDLNSVIKKSKKFFKALFRAEEIDGEINSVIAMTVQIKIRLENFGLHSDSVTNVTNVFLEHMKELKGILQVGKNRDVLNQLSEEGRRSVEVVHQLSQQADEMQQRSMYQEKDEESSRGVPHELSDISSSNQSLNHEDLDAEEVKEVDLYSQISPAVNQLLMEITGRGVGRDASFKLIEKIRSMWTCWQIDMSDLEFELDIDRQWKELGKGASGIVYEGYLKTSKDSKLPVAIKSVHINQQNIGDVLREVFLHLMAQHNAITTLHGMRYPERGSGRALIVVERMECTLGMALKRGLEIDLKKVLCDVASALAHLHENGIVHRDVKPGNILLSADLRTAKISDFGSSRRRSEQSVTATTMQAGTRLYMAPEVLKIVRCKTSRKWDTWSFGITLCEVVRPEGRVEFLEKQWVQHAETAKKWASTIQDSHLRAVAEMCLHEDPKERASMLSVFLHLAEEDFPALDKEQPNTLTPPAVLPQEKINMDISNSEPSPVPAAATRSVMSTPSQHPVISQRIVGRNWGVFGTVIGLESERAELSVENETDGNLCVRKIGKDGEEMVVGGKTVGPGEDKNVWKRAQDGGVSYLVSDADGFVRAACVVNGFWTRVSLGEASVELWYAESNAAVQMDFRWPLRSTAGIDCTLKIDNKRSKECTLYRVDEDGVEQCVDELDRCSIWSEQTKAGSVFIIREAVDGDFYFLFSIPQLIANFTIVM